MCEHAVGKSGAAALGYLIAMEEMEELKSEVEPASVYEKVLEVVDGLIACDGQHFAESACDEIFTIIYEWLIAAFADESNLVFSQKQVKESLDDFFRRYIVQE